MLLHTAILHIFVSNFDNVIFWFKNIQTEHELSFLYLTWPFSRTICVDILEHFRITQTSENSSSLN